MDPGTSIFPHVAVSLRGLNFPEGPPSLLTDPREQFTWAQSLNFRGVVLDCTTPLLRPRNLDRSARRDIGSTLNRLGLQFGGVDLHIPPSHLSDPSQQDRAFAAIRDALAFAAELASFAAGQACVTIPSPSSAPLDALAQLTESSFARLALLAWPVTDDLQAIQTACPKLGIAFDPARVLAQQQDPAKEISRLHFPPASIRLSDFDGVSRVPIGSGNLDVLSFGVAASLRIADSPFVLDFSGLPDAHAAARSAIQALS